LLLAACDQKAWFEKLIPKEPEAFSRQYLVLLQTRQLDSVEAQIDPKLKSADMRLRLEKMAGMFPESAPISVQTVGAETFATPQATDSNLTFQFQYPEKWLLANVATRKSGGQILVIGLNVYPLADSLEKLNAFTLTGKTAGHHVVLFLAAFVPLFIVYALVLCARTPIPKRKWLWVLFVLSGFGQFSLNWTDGALRYNLLSFLMFGGGAMKMGPYAPWIVSCSFPLGALVFLYKRKKWLEPQPAVVADATV